MSIRAQRGEQILKALTSPAISGLLPEGKEAIQQRFDPFHDLPVKPVGYPDDYSGHTVTRLIKKSVTFNSASGEGTPATGPWNFHVFNTPIATPMYFSSYTTTNNVGNNVEYNKDDTPTILYGGLMVIRSDNSVFENNPDNTTGMFLAQLALDSADIDNNARIVAQGWELRDNTAEIVKQGMITVYRQNEPQLNDFHMNAYDAGNGINATKTLYSATATMLRLPPETVEDALLIPGSKQWLLKEGVYAVTTFHSSELPMEVPKPSVIALVPATYNLPVGNNSTENSNYIKNISLTNRPSGFPDATDYRTIMTIPTTTPTVVRQLGATAVKLMPINQTGCMCMGAPKEGSYTLSLNTYVEEAVSLENKPLITLATQSPVYSPVAIRAMSLLTHDAPIAVKINENYLGEWFFDGLADIARSVVPWIGNAKTVANQLIKWNDNAKATGGHFQTPQSFVKGSVNTQLKKEKVAEKKANAVPKAPGPAPMKRAFKPVSRGGGISAAKAEILRKKKVDFAPHYSNQLAKFAQEDLRERYLQSQRDKRKNAARKKQVPRRGKPPPRRRR